MDVMQIGTPADWDGVISSWLNFEWKKNEEKNEYRRWK